MRFVNSTITICMFATLVLQYTISKLFLNVVQKFEPENLCNLPQHDTVSFFLVLITIKSIHLIHTFLSHTIRSSLLKLPVYLFHFNNTLDNYRLCIVKYILDTKKNIFTDLIYTYTIIHYTTH